MKHILYRILITCALLGNHVYAQEIKPKKNIVKLNFYTLLFNDAIDISYEKYLTRAQSIGISGYILHKNKYEMPFDKYKTYSITPYYRYHFEQDPNENFYLEIFTMFLEKNKTVYTNSTTEEDSLYREMDIIKNKGIATGLALGYTYTTKYGLFFDFGIGIGRNYAKHPETLPIVGRGGICIGKKF